MGNKSGSPLEASPFIQILFPKEIVKKGFQDFFPPFVIQMSKVNHFVGPTTPGSYNIMFCLHA